MTRVCFIAANMLAIDFLFILIFIHEPWGNQFIKKGGPDDPSQYAFEYFRETLSMFLMFYLNFFLVDTLFVRWKLFDQAPTSSNLTNPNKSADSSGLLMPKSVVEVTTGGDASND